MGVSLKKNIFFFGGGGGGGVGGGETHFHSVTTQTQAIVTIYCHCIVFLLQLNGNSIIMANLLLN